MDHPILKKILEARVLVDAPNSAGRIWAVDERAITAAFEEAEEVPYQPERPIDPDWWGGRCKEALRRALKEEDRYALADIAWFIKGMLACGNDTFDGSHVQVIERAIRLIRRVWT